MSYTLTKEQLLKIMPYAKARVDKFIGPLNEAMAKYGINESTARMAAFLAQIGHESGQLRYVEELASGAAYEGRTALGNTQAGDGVRYKGRGLIQITGRANYTQLARALGIDIVNNPELLEEPLNACMSAAWYWDSRKLNALADLNTSDSFKAITKKINGGLNGLADRQALHEAAKKTLNTKEMK